MPFLFRLVLSTIIYFFVAAAFRITGATGGIDSSTGTVPVRVEINTFSRSGPAFDLFVLAFQELQALDQADQLSYFQIAGIHGLPKIPWDGVIGNGQGRFAGYCLHSSVAFPFWHRPYLALFEQLIWSRAQRIAILYPAEQRETYQAAALNLRIPYWDWSLHPEIPQAYTVPNISINRPDGWHEVKNPLCRYDFHPGPEGNGFTDGDPIARSRFTIRSPDPSFTSSNNNRASQNMKAVGAQFYTSVYSLLVSVTDYTQFSSTEPNGVLNGYNNIENLHNIVHNLIGGTMFSPNYAGFDPIFWLHHAQVDRLVAIWQGLHPSYRVIPQTNKYGSYYQIPGVIESQDTVLAPFHSNEGTDMFTLGSVRNTTSLGYSYPELVDIDSSDSQGVATLRTRVNQIYNSGGTPSSRGFRAKNRNKRAPSFANAFHRVSLQEAQTLGVNNLEIEWSVGIELSMSATNEPMTVEFFMGVPPRDTAHWSTAANLIGTYSQFRTVASHRTTMDNHNTLNACGEVPLTHTLAAGVFRGYLLNMSPSEVVPLLRSHLTWRARTGNNREVSLDKVNGISVIVRSRDVKPSRNESEVPSYGQYVAYPIITSAKPGGKVANV